MRGPHLHLLTVRMAVELMTELKELDVVEVTGGRHAGKRGTITHETADGWFMVELDGKGDTIDDIVPVIHASQLKVVRRDG